MSENAVEWTTRQLADEKWETAVIEQRGPDGSTLIGLVYFYVCPICACIVAQGAEGEQYRYVEVHRAWHLDLSKYVDWVQ